MPLKRETEANEKTAALEKAIEVFYSREMIFLVDTVIVFLFVFLFLFHVLLNYLFCILSVFFPTAMPLKREAEANNKTTALEKAIEVFY